MLVLVNVIRGQCSTSRKFDERMSLSLIPLLVRMLAVEIVASTFAVSGWSGLMSAFVLTSLKYPRTVIIPRCFAENSTCVWYGSSCQLPTANLPCAYDVSERPTGASQRSGDSPQHRHIRRQPSTYEWPARHETARPGTRRPGPARDGPDMDGPARR